MNPSPSRLPVDTQIAGARSADPRDSSPLMDGPQDAPPSAVDYEAPGVERSAGAGLVAGFGTHGGAVTIVGSRS